MPEARNTSRQVARRQFIKTVAAFSATSLVADLGSPPLWGQVFDAARGATAITDVFTAM